MINKFVNLSFLLILLNIVACTSKTERLPNGEEKLSPEIVNNPATAAGTITGITDTSMTPQFLFEETTHHFGEITEGEVISYVFKFKNSGKSALVIAQVTASCGCTVPEYSKDAIEPGKSGEIKVTFNSSGKAGMVSKTITVLANTIPATKILTVSAEINQKSKK